MVQAAVIEVDIDLVHPNPSNPRTIKDANFKKLVKSLKEFPQMLWKRPPVVVTNGDSFMALGGNKRTEAAKAAGYKKIPIMIADDWDPEQRRRFIVLDNDQSGEWDFEMLKGQYDLAFLLDTTSIEIPSKFLLRGSSLDDEYEEPDIDNVVTTIVPGTLITMGPHRLICGDLLDEQVAQRLMDGKTARMIHTDPPYNVDYGSSKNPRHRIRSIANDKMGTGAWEVFCTKMYDVFKWSCSGDIYMWGASGPEGMRMRLWLVEAGCHWSATIIWNKDQLVLSPANYQRRYEPCFYGWFKKSSFNGERTEVEVWDLDRPKQSKSHPTMKPVDLCARAVNNSSKADDIVLDIFAGSGSTMVASHQLGRRCYAGEIEPRYCQVIVDRMKALDPKLQVKIHLPS